MMLAVMMRVVAMVLAVMHVTPMMVLADVMAVPRREVARAPHMRGPFEVTGRIAGRAGMARH